MAFRFVVMLVMGVIEFQVEMSSSRESNSKTLSTMKVPQPGRTDSDGKLTKGIVLPRTTPK